MSTAGLLEKLIEIERVLGRVDALTVRGMLLDAESDVLCLQQEVMAMSAELRELRAKQESASRAPSPVPRSRVSHVRSEAAAERREAS